MGHSSASGASPRRTLVIACGALAREFLAVKQANGWDHLDITCLPAIWHNHPHKIPEGVRRKIRAGRAAYDEILCLYGDCGTGGLLDDVLKEEGVERIDGPHCYSFFAGAQTFDAMQDEEIGTFYLTDFLVRHFDRFVIKGLGLDRHPQLLPVYFGNYRRVMVLVQFPDAALEEKARAAAERLGLPLVVHHTGLVGIEAFLKKAPGVAGDPAAPAGVPKA
ncbi:DUF1638 domain-containing protein [Labrys monachus]|uniref:DUF1638 domain-containing protein n=1 Tax=Labrys monachus TaxID=217067 RepID=A0ABU0F6U3_9HYPH|nr:DUF1638 domain-containing protein [Labrys monachus]MDQ0390343.1 hypothetical protein [Labrys monachus]